MPLHKRKLYCVTRKTGGYCGQLRSSIWLSLKTLQIDKGVNNDSVICGISLEHREHTMKSFFRTWHTLITMATLIVFTIIFVSPKEKNVTYKVTGPDGQMFVQTWKHENKRVLSYVGDESEGKFNSTFAYDMDHGAYFESYYIEDYQVHFRFEKSPADAAIGELLEGATYTVENEEKLPTKKVTIVKAVRHIDGRIICVTTVNEGNGLIRAVTKMFDGKNSDYYLPDEIIDRVYRGKKIISTVHIVAQGRNFLPIEHSSRDWV